MLIDLAGYGDEAVNVSLSDGNSTPIATQGLGALPTVGFSGRKWRFETRADGVQQVTLQSLAPRKPGRFKVTVKAKHWFTATAADQPAANTLFTVRISTACYTHAVTRKLD